MIRVLKFGGTSVANKDSISEIYRMLESRRDEGTFVVVVSALGGVTNQLIEIGELASDKAEYEDRLTALKDRHLQLCKDLVADSHLDDAQSAVEKYFLQMSEIIKGIYWVQELTQKTSDYLLSYGEKLSSTIISAFLQSKGIPCTLMDPTQFILTDSKFGSARVDFKESNALIQSGFEGINGVALVPGFIASNEKGQVTTLGRGGSDYSAAIIAAALNADELEIWTDVNGLMTADPRFVKQARTIQSISYEDAMELSHFGAKVIYPPTIQPVLDKKIPIKILNTFDPDGASTTITKDDQATNGSAVKGLSCIQNIALINLKGSGMVGIPNISHRLFRSLSEKKINIILITQASSEHSISVAIDETQLESAKEAIATEFEFEMSGHKIDPLEIETELSVIALVGSRMRHQAGISGRLFSSLGTNGINIKAIAQGSSERNISVVVDNFQVRKALNSLHESFFLSDYKRINLFIIGVGTVGGTFLEQLNKQRNYLWENQRLKIVVTGLANSRKMLFREDGIDLGQWKKELEGSESKFSIEDYKNSIYSLNLRNSIFIDNTASADIAAQYRELLDHSISVITPNKIACSSDYESYQELKQLAIKRNQKFYYETNVGAGLPVISTLNDLVKSGDRIHRIDAVLSGSLNFIFNTYDGTETFRKVIEMAMEQGYTEPDPRIDLSGIDVKRKILILMRESEINAELDDITTEKFIPEEVMNASDVDSFLAGVEENEEVFAGMYKKAQEKSQRIKYVATYDNGKATTGIQYIDESHPFYDLQGKDNIVLFYTDRYPDQPLVVKGAGAGAEVTASGIFADVMRYSS